MVWKVETMKLLFLTVLLPFFLGVVRPQGFTCEDNYLPDDERVDCAPGQPTDEQNCMLVRNCTWCPTTPGGAPWCYIPMDPQPQSPGYIMDGEPLTTPNGVRVNLVLAPPERSGKGFAPRREGEVERLNFDAEFHSNYRLRIRITDASASRWEVPIQINPAQGGNDNPLYDVEFSNDPLFSFKVIRKSSGAVLFDSSAGRFTYADQYLGMSWHLPSENVYGVGENEQHTFKHDFSQNTTWGLWARDQPPAYTTNMYGAQPHYTVLEANGNVHAVAIVNSNAQEFQFIEGPKVRYVTIGGILDFYFFMGPTPEEAVQQYTEAVGRHPLPPYSALGFHLCRYGYNTIENMKAAVDRTAAANIPHDNQYGDIDIMERELDFTYSETKFPGLPDYIRELKSQGIKFITILDPCISIGEMPGSYRPFDLGEQMNVWVRHEDGRPVTGKVWPADPVYFPDYSKNTTKEWWAILIEDFHDLLEYDALWIDMNEPANFVTGDINDGCPENKWNNPPYVPKIADNYLASKTLCPSHVEEYSRHYDTHNLYGWFESEPTLVGAIRGVKKRTMILSRSTFLGSGKWAAHWLGDNFSNWPNMYYSIIGVLQFNQWGIPFVGPDICGFIGDTQDDLCQRWMEVGAFYPFCRNHNGINYRDQDPGAFTPEIAESSRKALEIRYTLLPYLYTLFYKHHTEGSTVARALWHEFPTDPLTANIDRQFFWGSGFMITPVLEQGATSVQAYFPNARFYSYHNGSEVAIKGDTTTLDAPLDFINLHVRGGSILPTQESARNTELSRNNPMGLIIALDDDGSASGSLFFDEGDSLNPIDNGVYFYAEYALSNRTLSTNVIHDAYADMASKRIETIRLLGAGSVTSVTANGSPHADFAPQPTGEVLIRNLNLPANSAFTLVYN